MRRNTRKRKRRLGAQACAALAPAAPGPHSQAPTAPSPPPADPRGPGPGTVSSPPVAAPRWQGALPPAPSTQVSRSPTATDHTGCGHCFPQTKVIGQSHHFCLALPGTRWPDHRITGVHMPMATLKNPQRSGKFTKNSSPVPPAFCVGMLGVRRPDRTHRGPGPPRRSEPGAVPGTRLRSRWGR